MFCHLAHQNDIWHLPVFELSVKSVWDMQSTFSCLYQRKMSEDRNNSKKKGSWESIKKALFAFSVCYRSSTVALIMACNHFEPLLGSYCHKSGLFKSWQHSTLENQCIFILLLTTDVKIIRNQCNYTTVIIWTLDDAVWSNPVFPF